MAIWVTMFFAGLVTFGIRLSFIELLGKIELAPPIRRALRFVPPAVLTAIIFPELLLRDGSLNISLGNPRLLAGLLAIVVAWRTKNAVLTILAGMAGLYIFQAILVH
jgi:branched-subunit amino acid transport protein